MHAVSASPYCLDLVDHALPSCRKISMDMQCVRGVPPNSEILTRGGLALILSAWARNTSNINEL